MGQRLLPAPTRRMRVGFLWPRSRRRHYSRDVDRSKVAYVSVDGSDIAYQVVGSGERDILWLYALGSQIDLVWQMPRFATSLQRLASIGRVIIFDRRGSGASDPAPSGTVPKWEVLAEDIGAVLDAVGSKRTAVIGFRETGQIAMLYAAMHPERVSSLVLLNTTARYLRSDDHPQGEAPEAADFAVQLIQNLWGTEDLGRITSPELAEDPASGRTNAMLMRASATPTQAAAQYTDFLKNGDVRGALPSIQAPTLVLHVRDTALLPLTHGRYIADRIPGARFVELPGGDLGGGLPTGASEEIEEFLTGTRPIEPVDRILATVLFTDIVGSTEHLTRVGDAAWRSLLDRHDEATRAAIARFRGREVDTNGDGFVAAFDGPGRAIECAQALHRNAESLGVQIRAGLHTGECEVRGHLLAGLTVHIAARVCSNASAGATVVSRTVADLVAGSHTSFTDLGEHTLKGVTGPWRLYQVEIPT